MGEIIIAILLLAAIGALFAGGESFGDSLRKGCGCVIVLLFLLLVAMLIFPISIAALI